MHKLIQLTRMIPSLKNSLSRPALRRHALFAIVPAMAFVAVAVALSLLARAGRIEAGGAPSPKFSVVQMIPIPTNSQNGLTVNQALNKIYACGGFSSSQDVDVIDGMTFATTNVGTGSGVSVDNQTNRYWAASVFGASVLVRDGDTNEVIQEVVLGFCPGETTYDFKYNRVWVGAQCGNGDDPVFAVDATSPFPVVAGPIGSGGVMGPIIANGVNGRLYLVANGTSKRVDPITFAVTTNAFGSVTAINTVTNTLYALRVNNGVNNLQIINGTPDPEVILKTVPLPYSPGAIGINTALNTLYIANPNGNSLEVRDPSTGALITIFTPLPATPNGPMVVDSIRGRIYIISLGDSPMLMVVEDIINAFKPGAIISHF